MQKIEGFRIIPLYLLVVFICSNCGQSGSTNEDIIPTIETKGHIKTFPLKIILSDRLREDVFPYDIQMLGNLSGSKCKTLPTTGLLRLGGLYYTYNVIPDIKLLDLNNEEVITKNVDQQVRAYYAKTTPKSFDSLLVSNSPDWDLKRLAAYYISTRTDSIFFYTNKAEDRAMVSIDNKIYPLYNDVTILRQRIDELICNGSRAISVFYNFPIANLPSFKSNNFYPNKGTPAGDTCIGSSKYEKLNNGNGGFIRGKLIETNSTSCGYIASPVSPKKGPVNTPKYQTSYKKEAFKEPRRKLDTSIVRVKTEGSKAATTGAANKIIQKRYNQTSKSSSVIKDNICVSKSEPSCEQEREGNYTGRRVEYCYNKQGKIIDIIVIAKCDRDCRCF